MPHKESTLSIRDFNFYSSEMGVNWMVKDVIFSVSILSVNIDRKRREWQLKYNMRCDNKRREIKRNKYVQIIIDKNEIIY